MRFSNSTLHATRFESPILSWMAPIFDRTCQRSSPEPGLFDCMADPTAACELIVTNKEIRIAELRNFDQVVQTYWSSIFRFVLASVRDQDTAATLTQDCFWRAFRYRSGFRGDSSVNTWLIRIAVNLVRDFGANRRLQFWRRTISSSVDAHAISDHLPDPDVSAERRAIIKEHVEAVWGATAHLSEKQRTAFLLRFVEDMEVPEIAVVMGLSEGSVKVHLFRAVRSVRNQIGGMR
jgi:RNA polymerase sigma-70 factor (ECF subfamily)